MATIEASTLSDASPVARFPVRVGGRIPSLDGLRALAILLVLLSHIAGSTYAIPFLGTGRFPLHFMLGNLGVRIFFVISGFLITSLLLREHERTGSISLTQFYVRRALRILPASYAFLLVMAIAVACGTIAIPPKSFLSSFLYFRNYLVNRDWYTDHLWSLSIEEQFYLIWPAAMVVLGRRHATIAAFCTLPIAILMRLLGFGRVFETNMDALACGCLLASLWGPLGRNERWQRFLRSGLFWAVPLVVLISVKLKMTNGPYLAVGTGVANLLIAVSIERFVRYYSLGLARLLNARIAITVGTLSYSLYLWQQPWVHYDISRLQVFPVNIALAGICATLSFNLIERPFLRLRDRLRTIQ